MCLAHRDRWEDPNFQRQLKENCKTILIPGIGPLTIMAFIVATSVEYDRAFSTVVNRVSKVRSRLNDDAVDALCFLK